MSEDTDTTLWSLPDEMEAPRDELKLDSLVKTRFEEVPEI